jgi:acyl-CoA reductase-like NAD-dependent aldehyde dehydrogenase
MLKITSPFDLSLIKSLPLATEQQIENAIEDANQLFQNQNGWLPAYERIEILEKTIQLMKAKTDDFAILATKEGGKPLLDSKVEVLRAINGVKLAAQGISQLKGEQVPMGLTKASEGRIAFTTREPIGIVVSISAFNHPLNLIVHQVVTAVAAGCPVIIKPALTTPLSCLALVDILIEAGLPKGWCQVIICEDHLAEKLATDKRVNYLSFIGSAKVGWYLRSKLAPGTRCALEHGGSAPVIVDENAEVKTMLPALAKGAFYHAGQVCVSVQRLFVHESLIDEVVKGLKVEAEKLIIGDPLNENTEVGPLILPKEVDRIKNWIQEAISEGAELICGGKSLPNHCFEATILLNPSSESKVSKLEVFGPVVCVYTFSNIDDAIAIANSIDVHFQASVFTKDLDTVLSTVKKLNAAAVMVNDHTAFRVDWMPFGGRDTSGIGVGGIEHSMHEMTREKLMVIKSTVL